MMTLSDVSLPDIAVDYFIGKEEYTNSPLFNNCGDIAEKNGRLELELKNVILEHEECNMREIEMRKVVENLSALYTLKMKEIEVVTNSIKELEAHIKDIEDSKSKEELESLENAKKTLNVYKRMLKLKWLHPSKENVLESVIFNEKNAFLKYVEFNKNDARLVEKVWMEISQATSWKCFV